jgi:VWFA-related protein
MIVFPSILGSQGDAMFSIIKLIGVRLLVVLVSVNVSVPLVIAQRNIEPVKSDDSSRDKKDQEQVRPVVIQVTPHVRSLKRNENEEVITIGEITVKEDGEERKILSLRGIGNTPLSLAILIQDDVVSSIGNEIKGIGEFIKTLPKGSRVLVGYIKSGSLQVRQKFTSDLEKAIRTLRIPISSAAVAPYNPYVEIIEGLKRFEALPSGRRAMLVVTDGLDTSGGVNGSSASLSLDLQRAIREAQRRSVAVYSFYAPTVTATDGRNSFLINNAQGSLERLSSETGGRAFFQGLGAPVSFDPFLSELGESLFRQLAVTFLSTSKGKGFHKLDVSFGRTDLKVDYPTGYSR